MALTTGLLILQEITNKPDSPNLRGAAERGEMKIQILNKNTKSVIIEGDAENIKTLIEKNRGAYLRGAYLQCAYLQNADLRDAKIKITQKEDIVKGLGLAIDEE